MRSDRFTDGYKECAVWASTDDKGNPLDGLGLDLSTSAEVKMLEDCSRFQANNAELIQQAMEHQSLDRIGHDFWLTRNRHGAGFWDGDYPKELGDALTKVAHSFGECHLYVDDDGTISLE
jgi:hypothetical protein